MNRFSLSALVAAGMLVSGLSAGSASAADLGGNCCADLEERIAELEATTARKGNRKVSLTVSGWVAEQVMWWDDGVEDNVYVGGIGTTLATNVKFTGQATIMPGFHAGYVIHTEMIDSDDLTWNANSAVGPAVYQALGGTTVGYNVQVIQAFWFIKSDHMGKISVGQQSQASDNTAILVDGSGTLVPANWVAFNINSFAIRGNNTGLVWGGAQNCRGMGGAWGDCNGLTQEAIRYDSPTWGGFSVSASWGADDFWDVAARYSGEHHGFKLAAAVAYNEVTDEFYNLAGGAGNGLLNNGSLTVRAPGGQGAPVTGCAAPPVGGAGCASPLHGGTQQYFQAGIFGMHVHSGLWGLFNYGYMDDDFTNLPEAKTYYFKAGLRRRMHPLGHTIFYGEYLKGDDGGANIGVVDTMGGFSTSSDLKVWGLGVVQEIDAAAMSMWLSYRHMEYDDNAQFSQFEEMQFLKFGALINF